MGATKVLNVHRKGRESANLNKSSKVTPTFLKMSRQESSEFILDDEDEKIFNYDNYKAGTQFNS